VLYLLHGGGGDHADWVTYGNIQPTMDAVVAADARDAAIVVMPDGNDAQWYDGIDGKDMNETYVLKYVIPYVDRHYRTIADRRGRGIAGLSNGGYGALHFAAKAPQLFAAAGGMSSNIAARSMGGLGNSVESPAYFPGNIPARLYGNLDYVDVVMDLGAECKSDVTVDLCATFAFDQLFRPDHIYFDNLMKPGHVGAYDFRLTEGGHAWRWWTKWLVERDLPFILPRLDDPQPVADPVVASSIPSTFRYRSIFRTFDAWGYKVTIDQRDVREFLDLTNVTVGGMTVQGSGLITIETAPRYTPGAAYSVAGNSGVVAPAVVVADTTGRLTFPVDLGPSHVYEEESYPQQALVAAGGYWQHRDVSITAT
jgi:pimeloyl-ACP methyl ester carboxylesterase